MRKLYFDPESLGFRRSPRRWWRQIMALTAACLAAAFGLAVTMNLLSVSPTELAYKSENQALRDQLAASQERIDQFGKALDELVENDRELYRVILQADEVSDDILQVGTGGVDPYAEFDRFRQPAARLLRHSASMLDALERRISLQNASYRELNRLARSRQKAMSELPTIKPTYGRMVSHYGMRIHPISKVRRPHLGIDFTTPTGTPVFAAGDGVVHVVDYSPTGYGHYIVLEHREAGFRTLYAHLSQIAPGIAEGRRVRRGEEIALTGNTGFSAGPHLHYEVRDLEDRTFNPRHFIINLPPEEFRQLINDANSDVLVASMD
ncbi:MAG: M23 family metallopeptidase [Bacteroidota bacterium]|nr:M23 family metallopeptidase [Bacteroidota bacterium]